MHSITPLKYPKILKENQAIKVPEKTNVRQQFIQAKLTACFMYKTIHEKKYDMQQPVTNDNQRLRNNSEIHFLDSVTGTYQAFRRVKRI